MTHRGASAPERGKTRTASPGSQSGPGRQAAKSPRNGRRHHPGRGGYPEAVIAEAVAAYLTGADVEAVGGPGERHVRKLVEDIPGAKEARERALRARSQEREAVVGAVVRGAEAGMGTARDIVRRVGIAAVEKAEDMLPEIEPEQAPALLSAGTRAIASAESWAGKDQAQAIGAGVLLALTAFLARLEARGALLPDEIAEGRKLLEAAPAQSAQVVKVYRGADLRDFIT